MHKEIFTESTGMGSSQRNRGRPREFDRHVALHKAMRLFWVRGYEATSISDLTETMGIGTKSLYAAFGSKDALYSEALHLYSTTHEELVLGRFRKCATAREAVLAFLQDSARAMTGSDCDLPHGCMVNLGFVGSDGHVELSELMKAARSGAFEILKARFEKAVVEGDLASSIDVSKLARFVQTVQSGMAIRARDGADRADLEAVADFAMAGWDGITSRRRLSG